MRRLLAWVLTALIVGAASSPSPARAAGPPPSCQGEARQFDFWLGDWSIEQRILRADGGWIALPASTRVTASPDGCVLTEHWRGDVQFFWERMSAPEPIWGYSVRVYDPAAGKWSIYWMDSRAPRFGAPYVGTFAGARGEFRRTRPSPEGDRLDRIVFVNRGPGAVDWELSVSSDEGRTWTPVWTMAMRRKS